MNKLIKKLLNLGPKSITPNTFYTGVLLRKPISDCKLKDGYPVVTIEGDTGRIVNFYNTFWNPKKPRWLDIRLDNSSYKHTREDNVFAMFIQIKGVNKSFPLSHSCYKYLKIEDLHKKFQVRITNRGYAIFHDDFKHDREYVAILRRSRYGASFLNKLESNYKITKK